MSRKSVLTTVQKKAKEQLRDGDQRFAIIFENSPVAMAITRLRDNHLLEVNRAWLDLWGIEKQEAIHKTTSELGLWINPDERIQLIDVLNKQDQVANFEARLRSRTRGERIVLISAGKTVVNGDACAILQTMDITDRRTLENSLHESNLRFEQITTHIPEAFWIFDHCDHKMIYISPAYEKIYGQSMTGFYENPRQYVEAVHPDDHPIILAALAKQALGEPTETEYRIMQADGSIRWVYDRSSPIFAANKQLMRTTGIATDITERKQAEETLRLSQIRYRSLVEMQTDLVSRSDVSGKLTFVNDAYCHLMNLPRKELLGRNYQEFVHPDDLAVLHTVNDVTLLDTHRQYVESRLITPSGVRWFGWDSSIILDKDGKFIELQGVGRDITERKQAEESLRQSEQKYRDLINGMNDTVWVVDNNLQIVDVNAAASAILGYTRDELLAMRISDIDIAISEQEMMAMIRDAPLNEFRVFETQHRAKDGRIIPIEVNAGIVSYMGQNMTMGISRDITDRKQAQQKLEELNRTLEDRVKERTAQVQDLYDNAPVGYHSLDADGRLIAINQTELNWLGYKREELLGRYLGDIYSPQTAAGFPARFAQFKASKQVHSVEVEMVRKDGSIFPVMINTIGIYDKNGEYISSRSTMTNITLRKRAENELKRNVNFTNALLDAIPTPVFYKDINGRYQGCNHAFADIMGKSVEELRGKTVYELWPSDNAKIYHQKDLEILQVGGRQVYESTINDKNGNVRSVIFIKDLFHDESGKVAGIVGAFIDITERKHAEEILQLANAEMQRAMRVKDEFLASMSHELRTPLTGILGLSEVLQMGTYGALNEKQIKALKNIESSGRHLLELINDILDLSKIEAGKLEMQFDACALEEICQASLQITKSMAHQKRQNVSFAMNPASIVVQADGRRLKQMLVNLLSNAIKFTPQGGEIGLEVRLDTIARQVALTVWDKGVGIAVENLHKLFKPFVQLDSRLARQYSGTGLGLSLVHRMAELHHGTVNVESQAGEGSRFTILLPWSMENTQPNLPQSLPETVSLRSSLTVEDTDIDAEQITHYLQNLGISNVVHTRGQGAVEAAIRLNPDIILLDLNLPDKPGFEVLRELKANPHTKHIPVVICSVEESRQKALASGADHYLTKPFTLKEMRSELSRVTLEHKKTKSVMTIAAQHYLPLVLLADDNEITLDTISDFLSAKQFKVLVARSGMEVLDLLVKTHPDIILMDIQMPEMDGLETTRRVRANKDALVAQIPIIALTALAMPGDPELCLQAGANDYISKPVVLSKLVERINILLKKRAG